MADHIAVGATFLFSGRFDPPHPGHLANIILLSKEYLNVKVVILDEEKRRFSVAYSKYVIDDFMKKRCNIHNVEVLWNKIHFEKITLEQLDEFQPFSTYGAGNHSVLRHIESLGIHSVFVERKYDYEASKYSYPDELSTSG